MAPAGRAPVSVRVGQAIVYVHEVDVFERIWRVLQDADRGVSGLGGVAELVQSASQSATRILEAHEGKAFTGLQQALSQTRRSLPAGIAKRLRDLHTAAAVVRHASAECFEALLNEVDEALRFREDARPDGRSVAELPEVPLFPDIAKLAAAVQQPQHAGHVGGQDQWNGSMCTDEVRNEGSSSGRDKEELNSLVDDVVRINEGQTDSDVELLRFHTSQSGSEQTCLKEYGERTKHGQEHISYIIGDSDAGQQLKRVDGKASNPVEDQVDHNEETSETDELTDEFKKLWDSRPKNYRRQSPKKRLSKYFWEAKQKHDIIGLRMALHLLKEDAGLV